MNKLLMMIGAAAVAAGARASSITINSITQRWPWNNKVDISYTVTNGQNTAAGSYCAIRFEWTLNAVAHGENHGEK